MSPVHRAAPYQGTALVVVAALALGLQTGLFVAGAALAVLFWAVACVAALAVFTLIDRSSAAEPADRPAEICALGGFGIAWASGALIVGAGLDPAGATLFHLGLVISAGALAFLTRPGLLWAGLLVLPALLLSCGAEWVRHGPDPALIAFLGIGIFALAAAGTLKPSHSS